MNALRNAIVWAAVYALTLQPVILSARASPAEDLRIDFRPVATSMEVQPREAVGVPVHDDEERVEPAADKGLAENGEPYAQPPFMSLPRLDPALLSDAAERATVEMMRVIIYLDYLPHRRITDEVRQQYAAQYEAIDDQVRQIHALAESRRDPLAKTDAENYSRVAQTPDERDEMRRIGAQREALDLAVMQQIKAVLVPQIRASQNHVARQITRLGGKVEFGTIAGNVIVALVPAGSVSELARLDGVLRVTGDVRVSADLDLSDGATLVDPPDGTPGLWDAGQCGGLYDGAVVDSGLDVNHPAMQDSVAEDRTNFYSWYLSAGAGDPDYDDSADIDDRQGHGTHVSGIVGSYGSSGWTAHLGMANCVQKLVTLKAAWLNSDTGGASMYWSDKYSIVDRVMYHTSLLQPWGAFGDDIETINLSYSGETTADDTDSARFWDAAIDTYPDLFVTMSAGNSGPGNALFREPALAYNAMTVANVQDNGTEDRSNDTMRASSTEGPTANDRRKPDMAAHGTWIMAPNNAWEGGGTANDMISKSGTSMAAPMVMGVALDLMDAGITDGLEIKALLINTAQKNLPSINIEGDVDGWDEKAGWGVMNALEAYGDRSGVRTFDLTPRLTVGDYKLFLGTMRDEGAAGQGRDRATMVWNRTATYNDDEPPTSYYNLPDLNLRLYDEEGGSLIDIETDGNDNVHQVRVNSGDGPTSVIVKPYAWSTSFAHGGSTEEVALALEPGFVEVTLPQPIPDMQGVAIWPYFVEPNEEFSIESWVRNDANIATHSNQFELILPTGFTLIGGPSGVVSAFTAAANGGTSQHITWTIRAPNTAVGAQTIAVRHYHESYAEVSNTVNWNMSMTVEWDDDPPLPDPMCFSTDPHDLSTTTLRMIACNANDVAHNPVEYFLEAYSTPTGGFGISSSGWQSNRDFVDTGLGTNHQYCYRAWARDSSSTPTLTSPSGVECAFTAINPSTGVNFGNITTTSIQVNSVNTPSGLGRGASGLRYFNTTQGTDSGLLTSNVPWVSAGLAVNSAYTFMIGAYNGDGDLASSVPSGSRFTLANPPAAAGFSGVTETSIIASLNANGNPGNTTYLFENVTAGVSSGWTFSTAWVSGGLTCGTSYTFQARARNGDTVETIIVPLGVQSTADCSVDTDGDGVFDDVDNCTLLANADQRDTNGDGFGNVCDPDLDGNLIVNAVDLGLFKSVFFTADPHADFNGDGSVNAIDLGTMKLFFFGPPGPSGLAP